MTVKLAYTCTETHNHAFPIMLCSAGAPIHGQTDILQEVMNEVSGKSFTPQDPADGIWLSAYCYSVY